MNFITPLLAHLQHILHQPFLLHLHSHLQQLPPTNDNKNVLKDEQLLTFTYLLSVLVSDVI
jgi:hypothetical protein